MLTQKDCLILERVSTPRLLHETFYPYRLYKLNVTS